MSTSSSRTWPGTGWPTNRHFPTSRGLANKADAPTRLGSRHSGNTSVNAAAHSSPLQEVYEHGWIHSRLDRGGLDRGSHRPPADAGSRSDERMDDDRVGDGRVVRGRFRRLATVRP